MLHMHQLYCLAGSCWSMSRLHKNTMIKPIERVPLVKCRKQNWHLCVWRGSVYTFGIETRSNKYVGLLLLTIFEHPCIVEWRLYIEVSKSHRHHVMLQRIFWFGRKACRKRSRIVLPWPWHRLVVDRRTRHIAGVKSLRHDNSSVTHTQCRWTLPVEFIQIHPPTLRNNPSHSKT